MKKAEEIEITFYKGSYIDFLDFDKKQFTYIINYIDIASSFYKYNNNIILEETFSDVLVNLQIYKRITRIITYNSTKKQVLYYLHNTTPLEVQENIKNIFKKIILEKNKLVNIKFKEIYV